jgi:Tfp pilus assembly protein FimT
MGATLLELVIVLAIILTLVVLQMQSANDVTRRVPHAFGKPAVTQPVYR